MRRVKFLSGVDLSPEKRDGTIKYPDDIEHFTSTNIVGDYIYADYSGDDETIESGDERLFLTLNFPGVAPSDETESSILYLVEKNTPLNFDGGFSQSINETVIPLSLLSRDNLHLKNLSISVVNGAFSGSVTFEKDTDYHLTSSGINHHKSILGQEIHLNKEIIFRVH